MKGLQQTVLEPMVINYRWISLLHLSQTKFLLNIYFLRKILFAVYLYKSGSRSLILNAFLKQRIKGTLLEVKNPIKSGIFYFHWPMSVVEYFH